MFVPNLVPRLPCESNERKDWRLQMLDLLASMQPSNSVIFRP
jgi:hypothetical protein